MHQHIKCIIEGLACISIIVHVLYKDIHATPYLLLHFIRPEIARNCMHQ